MVSHSGFNSDLLDSTINRHFHEKQKQELMSSLKGHSACPRSESERGGDSLWTHWRFDNWTGQNPSPGGESLSQEVRVTFGTKEC